MVNVVCSSRYKINRPEIKLTSSQLLKQLGVASHYVLNLIFIGRNKMKTIAARYDKGPTVLPVLSFAYDREKDDLLGEIFICYPQAVLLAAERNKKVETIIEQLIKHGVENLLK